MISPYSIRLANEQDASEISRLLAILGHPTTSESILTRWSEWMSSDNMALVAANEDGSLAGVATLHKMMVLHRLLPVGRITALVVDTPQQGQGIGRALVRAAEETLAKAGCGLLEITSHVRLEDAHAFYSHLGYEQTSLRFVKNLYLQEN